MTTDNRPDVYELIRGKILDALDKGIVPWQRPWNLPTSRAPFNAVSKKPYRGMNLFLLTITGYSDPRWVTFKQAQSLKGKVRKGEKSSIVVFWKIMRVTETDASGKEKSKTIPLLRYYNVFNVEQCDDLKLKALPVEAVKDDNESIAVAEALIAAMPNAPRINRKALRACYSPSQDLVSVPALKLFESSSHFYATLFHELTHSTGHLSRLDRFSVEEQTFVFASDTYSKEELTAEFGSAFLCAAAGIDNTATLSNSASYISSWYSAIKSADKRMLVSAASKAQKAAEYILGSAAVASDDSEETSEGEMEQAA